MRSSARRRHEATLAAVAAFTTSRQRVRAAAVWVAVLELLDLEEGTEGDGPHARHTRTVVPRPDYQQSPWANMLRNQVYYWIYWGTSYFTFLTWILAVLAAALDSWVKLKLSDEYETLRPQSSACDDDGTNMCSLYQAAYAFQYMATIVITFTPPIIFIASFAPAGVPDRLGFALGITLAVFSVFELIAFSAGAAFFSEADDFYYGISFLSSDYGVTPGPTLGLAVTAWIFGVAGTILVLTLRTKATADQDGPGKNFLVPRLQQATNLPIAVPPPSNTTKEGPPPTYTEDTV